MSHDFTLPGVSTSQGNTILSLVSIAENDTTSWWENYTYIQDIGDGRGYTINIVGFCTGTGDFLWLVENLFSFDPNNPLCKYLPALRAVNGTPSHDGLGGLPTLIQNSGNDINYIKATWNAINHFYWGPVISKCEDKHLVNAVTKGQLYDICLNMGDLSLCDKIVPHSPRFGGNEKTWLAALQALWLHQITVVDKSLDEGQPDRALMWAGLDSNLDLTLPISVKCYGDSFKIE